MTLLSFQALLAVAICLNNFSTTLATQELQYHPPSNLRPRIPARAKAGNPPLSQQSQSQDNPGTDISLSLSNETISLRSVSLSCKDCSIHGSLGVEHSNFSFNTDALLSPSSSTSFFDIIDGGVMDILLEDGLRVKVDVEAALDTTTKTEIPLGVFPIGPAGFVLPAVGAVGVTFEPVVVIEAAISEPVSVGFGFKLDIPAGSSLQVDLAELVVTSSEGFENAMLKPLPLRTNPGFSHLSGSISISFRPQLKLGISFNAAPGIDAEAVVGIFASLPSMRANFSLVDASGNKSECSDPSLPRHDWDSINRVGRRGQDDSTIGLMKPIIGIELGVNAALSFSGSNVINGFGNALGVPSETQKILFATSTALAVACLDPQATVADIGAPVTFGAGIPPHGTAASASAFAIGTSTGLWPHSPLMSTGTVGIFAAQNSASTKGSLTSTSITWNTAGTAMQQTPATVLPSVALVTAAVSGTGTVGSTANLSGGTGTGSSGQSTTVPLDLPNNGNVLRSSAGMIGLAILGVCLGLWL
ncbi:hypothetical protein K402DRAFT_18896 [Aulographum hederae CBS 113979]|uniref:DUF7223 domain-containing protein n=1 Tax=Aulographum hederae CBS 113979 TaxID=1176131 RepID=A0A6G1H6P3_9PEZI|nr:hypothetical protein K402DRAFT_18896 [Aulographum hederae CBS 113979]